MMSSEHTEKYLKTLRPLPERVLIFAHDAGGANATFAFALELEKAGMPVCAFGEGVATQIYQSNIPHMLEKGPPTFKRTDWVITGLSGTHSRFEVDMIRLARSHGVQKITSILDVHYNIEYRFIKDGKMLSEEYLPDEILVPGLYMRTGIPIIDDRLVDRPNPYFQFVKEKHYSTPPNKTEEFVKANAGSYWLYLTEYIQDQYGDSLGFDEFTLLDQFLKIISEFETPPVVVLKLHPQESATKYDTLIQKYPGISVHTYRLKLQELLYYSKYVFGCMSTVFYEGAMLEKMQFSLQFNCQEKDKIREILFPLKNNVKVFYTTEEFKNDLNLGHH